MTEEIIKECKNCDALGIDSEIGVYYCCLSHRQDDLPKEFTCNDFTPNKQLKRLEQENKEIYENGQIEITKLCNEKTKYRSALEEIKNDLKEICKEECDYTKPKFCGDCDCRYGQILDKINEVLK